MTEKVEVQLTYYEDASAACSFISCALQAIFQARQPVSELAAYGLYNLLDLLEADIKVLQSDAARAISREAET